MSGQVTFEVDGMTCASCVGRVERTLKALPGVQDAHVNLVAGTARVAYDTPAEPAAMASALKGAGYPVVEVTARLAVEGMTCASCVARVERALLSVPGVASAEVNLATERVTARYVSGVASTEALIAAIARAGYTARPLHSADAAARDSRRADEAAALRRRVIVAAALTLPVVFLAMGGHMIPAVHHWILATLGERTSALIQMVLTAAVLLGPGLVFFRHGIPALLRGAPEMNSLVALGALAAFGYSAVVTIAPEAVPAAARGIYFEAAAAIVSLILVGRLLEARAKGQAGEAILRLVGLRPETARVERPGGAATVRVDDLVPGDIVMMLPGERVAVDGIVTAGTGWIDESMLTGEPAPVAKAPGGTVTGGTVNGTGALSYRVTATGADTVLARIIRLVEDAQGTKLPVQALVDRITRWFVPAVMALAILAFCAWLLFGPSPAFTHALVAGISVLIIACPCAMGLATPVSILVGTGRGAELGVLFRRGDALQKLAEVRVVAFDKTGTLTEGRPRLTDLITGDDVDADTVLALAAGAEAQSEHPLARAILAEAASRGLEPLVPERAETLAGRGLRAVTGGKTLLIGNARLMAEERIDTAALADPLERLTSDSKTPVFVAIDGRLAALMAIADPVKPGAAAAIADLKAMGLRTAMISGDNRATATAIARSLGIDHVEAEVLPEAKVAAIRALGSSGVTAFVGDGINDAPALAAADIGIAMGTGTDVAIESAEVVLMKGDPLTVSDAIHLSRATMRNIRQNLFWAFGYNVLLIPVAAGVLYPLNGMLLSPVLAAGAMALSSVFVVTNALRLRRVGPWSPRS